MLFGVDFVNLDNFDRMVFINPNFPDEGIDGFQVRSGDIIKVMSVSLYDGYLIDLDYDIV